MLSLMVARHNIERDATITAELMMLPIGISFIVQRSRQ
jgi:hypothetical protein